MHTVVDPHLQASLIRLIIAWTLVGAFLFTVVVTCISLIRPNTIPNRSQQKKLFTTLIVELVVICLGAFSNLLTLAPREVQEDIATKAVSDDKAQKNTSSPTLTPHPTAMPLASPIPSPAETPVHSPSQTTVKMKVVTVHVGGDDSKESIFTYEAPPGYVIRSYRLRERAKGGDAHYSAARVESSRLEVKWSVKSNTVRILGVVVNTITAFLNLDAEITLESNAGT